MDDRPGVLVSRSASKSSRIEKGIKASTHYHPPNMNPEQVESIATHPFSISPSCRLPCAIIASHSTLAASKVQVSVLLRLVQSP